MISGVSEKKCTKLKIYNFGCGGRFCITFGDTGHKFFYNKCEDSINKNVLFQCLKS